MRTGTKLCLALAALALAPLEGAAQAARGWIGVRVDSITVETKGRPDQRLYIRNLVIGSPAQRAGVMIGDTIVTINGTRASHAQLVGVANRIAAGEKLRFGLRRNGRMREVAIVAAEQGAGYVVEAPTGQQYFFSFDTLTFTTRQLFNSAHKQLTAREAEIRQGSVRQPARFEALHIARAEGETVYIQMDTLRSSMRIFKPGTIEDRRVIELEAGATFIEGLELGRRAVAGAEFLALREDLAAFMGRGEGLFTVRVAPGTPASRAGLLVGDIVIAADGRMVRVVPDLRAAIAGARQPVVLRVVRKDKPLELRLH